MLRKMVNFHPAELVEYYRSNLLEQVYSGFLVKVLRDGTTSKIGDDKDYPFYLRSCAKPLQATVLIDLGVDKTFNFTPEEIAISSSSHSGDDRHLNLVKKILAKTGLDETYLHCGIDKPLSEAAQENLIKTGQKENQLHNNCSGKHAMMLTICKHMGWSLNDYYKENHPLQLLIKNKIYELCELKKEYPITKDGCGVPICSMPLKNMANGYLNVFSNEKYSAIKNAFLKYPELVTGENRLDNAIMSVNKDLIMKGGAGGICVIINLKSKEGLAVKMTNLEKHSRAVTIIEALKQLGWLDEKMLETESLKKFNQKKQYTLLGEEIGGVNFLFDLKK